MAVSLLLNGCAAGISINSSNNFSSTVSDSSAIINSSRRTQVQSNTASSVNESDQNISISAFNGTVSNDKLPLIKIPDNKWEQAKQNFISEYPFLKSTMKGVKISDFVLSDNWNGIINKEPFKLNVYSLQSQFLLVVSEYGSNPAKIKLFISSPKSVFAFYEDSVWLLQRVKGVGEPLNIINNDFGGLSSQPDNFNLEFGQLFTKLSAIEPKKRSAGTKLQIDGINLLIMRDMDIVIINK